MSNHVIFQRYRDTCQSSNAHPPIDSSLSPNVTSTSGRQPRMPLVFMLFKEKQQENALSPILSSCATSQSLRLAFLHVSKQDIHTNFFHSNMALEFNEIRMSIKSARGMTLTDSCTRIWVALRGTRFTPPPNHRLICLLCHHRKDCMSSCFTTLALQPFSSIGSNKVWGRFQPRRKSNGIAVRTASVHVLIPPTYWSGSLIVNVVVK